MFATTSAFLTPSASVPRDDFLRRSSVSGSPFGRNWSLLTLSFARRLYKGRCLCIFH